MKTVDGEYGFLKIAQRLSAGFDGKTEPEAPSGTKENALIQFLPHALRLFYQGRLVKAPHTHFPCLKLKVAVKFVQATHELLNQLLENPRRGQIAGFEASELADLLRVSVPGFPVFALFYRWNGQLLTVITLEHTAQDLPARLANKVSTPTRPN